MATAASELTTPISGDIAESAIEELTDTHPVAVIEAVIASLDTEESAMVSKTGDGHTWKFKYGTVEVFVHLTGESDQDSLTVWSTVLKLPVSDEAKLFRELLELNWSTTLEARFALMGDEIVVVASRPLADIAPGEISRAVTIVATLADENDEPLQANFK